jgi:hypothetical protein
MIFIESGSKLSGSGPNAASSDARWIAARAVRSNTPSPERSIHS